eukprot:15351182-Alexandrium_andersonii.AAC.1
MTHARRAACPAAPANCPANCPANGQLSQLALLALAGTERAWLLRSQQRLPWHCAAARSAVRPPAARPRRWGPGTGS